MSDDSSARVFTESGLELTPQLIDTLEAVGLETMANYYRVVYNLFFE